MVETTAIHKKVVGNICLHRHLAPQRRFLRRNLRHILDSHEISIQQQQQRVLAPPPDDPARAGEDMIANEKRFAGWDYPTREMLDDLVKGQKPFLRIRALQIRHPRSKVEIDERSRGGDGDDEGLDWLPHPGVEFSVPCTVTVSVADPAAPKTRLCSESRPATIRQYLDDRRFPYFDIELDRPFLIELDKLFTVTASGRDGYHWKRTITAKYTLEISIHCRDSEDTAALLGRLEGRDTSSYRTLAANEGVLNASWEELPECPSPGQPLVLKRTKGHRGNKPLEPEYRLAVAMGWTRRRETPLELYNKARARLNRPARQLPTPSASEDLDKGHPQHQVTYKYQDGLYTRSTTIRGFFCPLCPNSHEQPSFDRLRLHCATYHDHFTFQAENNSGQAQPATNTNHIVWIALSEQQYERQRVHGSEDFHINWVAPQRPFDISAHLTSGDEDWLTRPRAKAKERRGRPAATKHKDTTPLQTPQPVRKRPALDDVEDIPGQRPRKRQVPNVPNVTFYHTKSKHSIEPGSRVSDSDEGVDESWLSEKNSRALVELEIEPAAREFIGAFHAHMEREKTDSTVLVREALVRFTRNHLEELQETGWKQAFQDKLLLLRRHNVIGEETMQYCRDRVRSAGDDVPATSGEQGTPGADGDAPISNGTNGVSTHVNGKATIRERMRWSGGRLVPHDAGQAPSSPKPKSTCKCGESASGDRSAIACADPRCGRKDFHIGCVGLEKRVYGWRCADCSL